MSYLKEMQERLSAEKAKVWATVGEHLPEGISLHNRRADHPAAWQRDLKDGSGDIVGVVSINSGSGYHSRVAGFKLESSRIPNPRNQWKASRNYQKVESLIKAINEFCQPVNDTERQIEMLEGQIDSLKRDRDSEVRNLDVSRHEAKRAVELLASGDEQGETKLARLISNQREANGIRQAYQDKIGPLVERLYGLQNAAHDS